MCNVKLCVSNTVKGNMNTKNNQHDEKKKKVNKNAQKWNSNLSIKTVNSNCLK